MRRTINEPRLVHLRESLRKTKVDYEKVAWLIYDSSDWLKVSFRNNVDLNYVTACFEMDGRTVAIDVVKKISLEKIKSELRKLKVNGLTNEHRDE